MADKKGTILEISSNFTELTGFRKKEVVGKNISQILIPIKPLDLDFTHVDFMNKNPECPQNLFVRVTQSAREKHASERIFLLAYLHERSAEKKEECILISLVLQTHNSPLFQMILNEYHRLKQPFVLINDRNEICFYSGEFLTLLNVFDQSKVHYGDIFDYIEEKYRRADLFSNKKKLEYIQTIAGKKGEAWNPIFRLFPGKGRKISLSTHFFKNRCLRARYTDNQLALNPAPPAKGRDYAFLIYSRAVNFPNQDFKIDLNMSLEQGSSFNISLGRPFAGDRASLFDHGYSMDVDYFGTFTMLFSRMRAPVTSGKTDRIRPGEFFDFSIQRIGAFFLFLINGEVIATFADPEPCPELTTSHLYFYFWDRKVTFRQMNISTRPTLFNMEEMRGDEQLVSFKLAPDRLFRFTVEPTSYINRSYRVIHFWPVPVLKREHKKHRSVSLFEEAREYIQNNYYRKIDFHALARKCCVSHIAFIKKFKSMYGYAPNAYQIEWKLKEAQVLLKSGKYKVREVGEMVGIDNESYFQRLFKKYFKVSPFQWAKGASD
jgi:AraC-like DNA-binding protein